MECSRGIDDAVEILDSTAHLEARAIHHFRFLLLFTFMFLVSAFRIKIKQFALSNKNKLPVQAFKSLRQQYSKINNEVYLL